MGTFNREKNVFAAPVATCLLPVCVMVMCVEHGDVFHEGVRTLHGREGDVGTGVEQQLSTNTTTNHIRIIGFCVSLKSEKGFMLQIFSDNTFFFDL